MTKRQLDRTRGPERVLLRRLSHFPRNQNCYVEWFRIFAAVIIRLWLRIYHRFEIVGQQQLRTNRPLVIVANHSSHLDVLCLLASLPIGKLSSTFPVAAADYFFISLARTWVAAVVLNALPFMRQLGGRRSLGICAGLIAIPGNVLIIFPEGTRSTTGCLQPFKPGVGALVAGRDVTVVPCWLQGTFEAWPKGRRLPHPGKIRLIVGTPCDFANAGTSRQEIASIANRLRSTVQNLADINATH